VRPGSGRYPRSRDALSDVGQLATMTPAPQRLHHNIHPRSTPWITADSIFWRAPSEMGRGGRCCGQPWRPSAQSCGLARGRPRSRRPVAARDRAANARLSAARIRAARRGVENARSARHSPATPTAVRLTTPVATNPPYPPRRARISRTANAGLPSRGARFAPCLPLSTAGRRAKTTRTASAAQRVSASAPFASGARDAHPGPPASVLSS
jgi:hypothetical protein